MIESCITFLPVSDLQRTVRFYTEVVGLRLWKEMGSCVILDCGRGYWGFCQYQDGRPLATRTCMSLNGTSQDEVDEQYRRLTALGVPTLGQPQRHEHFPVYSFFFRDPDGYLLEFQRILDDEACR